MYYRDFKYFVCLYRVIECDFEVTILFDILGPLFVVSVLNL